MSAAARVREFVDAYGGGASDENVILRTLTPTKGVNLTTADLYRLVMMAEAFALEHPARAAIIEHGPSLTPVPD